MALLSNALPLLASFAAAFSALSSFLIWRISRQNLLAAVRPELVLGGWTRRPLRTGDTELDAVVFETLTNVGRGFAMHIHVNAYHIDEATNRPIFVLSSLHLPTLAPNETATANGEIALYWKNVEPDEAGSKHLPIAIELIYRDSGSMQYKTRYVLVAVPERQAVANPIARGVMQGERLTTRKRIRQRRLRWNTSLLKRKKRRELA